MDDKRFWAIIETAWQVIGGMSTARQMLADGTLSEAKAIDLERSLAKVLPAIRQQLNQLPPAELLAFDRILERKLYDIDRAEIQERTDGSDDGFLYARGFIVVAGREYYEAVNAKPSVAMVSLECEQVCYLSTRIHEEKYGELSQSGISRESCSNKAYWPHFS